MLWEVVGGVRAGNGHGIPFPGSKVGTVQSGTVTASLYNGTDCHHFPGFPEEEMHVESQLVGPVILTMAWIRLPLPCEARGETLP